ncbi:hypothetical protein FO440_07860 [Mucilaginibacter corticis]|uniref:Uncharacterized protein n=1 Tax=Mucilaginibacter corticis TaxID=2597670 RepID=A0A556MWA2_9SPHI|nr:hypothetical protein [Mucilaginibacter corticis]TSJ44079.1 hypothetical protein FO440_07860 [Mucilaginibacter corticis]
MKTDDSNAGLTQDQAVDLAVSSMAGSTYGFASVANSEASSAISMNNISTDGGKTINAIDPNTLYQKCGTTVADSLASAGTANSITYSSLYKFARTLNCTADNIGTNVVDNITFKGSFTAPKLKSTDYGTSKITITGLASTATQYTVSGTYNRIGSFTTLGGQKYYGTSNVTLTSSNVLFTKPGGILISGTASAVITGSSNYGKFSYKGIFKFIGGNKATLTMGTLVYNIDLVTGYYAQQ